MQEKDHRNLLIAGVVVVVILLLVLYYAYDKCHLGKYSKKGCPQNKGSFCGADPDPAAAAERKALREMGWRPGPLTNVPGPRSPCPGGASSAAIAEAQALQQAYALQPGSPYYVPGWTPIPDPPPFEPGPVIGPSKSSFAARGTEYTGCGEPVSPEALGEADMMYALQAGPGHYDVDGFAARKLSRDKAAFSSTRARSENLRSNPAQTSARQARLDSMREGFGGPAPPSTGGRGNAQSVGAAHCLSHCIDGCIGTNCADLCKDQCSQ